MLVVYRYKMSQNRADKFTKHLFTCGNAQVKIKPVIFQFTTNISNFYFSNMEKRLPTIYDT